MFVLKIYELIWTSCVINDACSPLLNCARMQLEILTSDQPADMVDAKHAKSPTTYLPIGLLAGLDLILAKNSVPANSNKFVISTPPLQNLSIFKNQAFGACHNLYIFLSTRFHVLANCIFCIFLYIQLAIPPTKLYCHGWH